VLSDNILFGCAQTKKADQGQTSDIVSAVSWIRTSKLDET